MHYEIDCREKGVIPNPSRLGCIEISMVNQYCKNKRSVGMPTETALTK